MTFWQFVNENMFISVVFGVLVFFGIMSIAASVVQAIIYSITMRNVKVLSDEQFKDLQEKIGPGPSGDERDDGESDSRLGG